MDNQVKTWFVTGASKGLGLSLVKQLLEKGQKVAATSRNLQQLIDNVGYSSNNFLPLAVNLADDTSVKAAVNQTVTTFGSIDVLINNAGYGIGGSLEELTDNEVRAAFDVNVFGTINTIRHTLPHMRQQRNGHIINISSIAGYAAGTGWSAYAGTKFALFGLTEVLADDVKSFGIKATVVAPGAFRTSFLTDESIVLPATPISEYEDVRASNSKTIALDGKQAGDPEKAAAIMIDAGLSDNPPLHLFLGSDAYRRATAKIEAISAEITSLEDLTISTDY
ncbi:short-chain dehydrogenase [Flavobacterium akiainvivens]|uniref:Short-chain dehydrogenase n=1 Tax=Flavobacterium akiainvivens TaxID=1202724 RepID=A0A0M9VJP0_9FLAO|nr:SDR family NAD(P)-dependent oxidoreductase [Flavobacterium akiainvivens]KOS07979.1 short-chain dehydrogenase [Flavobacterium akiainvivens]SFQ61503.1 Short-chain dehydrogenase [Flavobacterium akiainvivens]